jgi:hypothetical protein
MLDKTMHEFKIYTGLSAEEILAKVSSINLPYFDVLEFLKHYPSWPNDKEIEVISSIGIEQFITLKQAVKFNQ